MASNAENISIWWRHHGVHWFILAASNPPLQLKVGDYYNALDVQVTSSLCFDDTVAVPFYPWDITLVCADVLKGRSVMITYVYSNDNSIALRDIEVYGIKGMILIHWSRDKMATSFQTFSDAISSMKM